MTDPFRLDGQVALVTGGGSGLGLGMAEHLALAGARVVIIGRRREPLEAAAARIDHDAVAIPHDLARLDQAPTLIDGIQRRCGRLDILVNNAGVHLKKPVEDVAEDEFQTLLTTHVLAAHALTRHVVPAMAARGAGCVINIVSMTALLGMPRVVAYSAAKSALVGVTRALAVELGPRGIRVNAIAPGWIESPMLRQALSGDPERERRILQRTPLGRFGDPADIGRAAVYLASPAAAFINGVVLPIDGGAAIGF